MKSAFLHLGIVFVFILFAGCSSAATETPAPIFPTDTETPLPPTATVAPPVGSPTPIPTANFTLVDITGTWFRNDTDRGTLYFIIKEDGTYIASHGSPDVVIHSGSYTLEGRLFTFVDGWDCSSVGDIVGLYILRLAGGGKYLTFEPLADECPDRPGAFKSVRWDRFETAPTP